MQVKNIEEVNGISNSHDLEDIEEDTVVPSDPLKTVSSPSKFVIGRPFAHKVCIVEVEDEVEIYAIVNNRSMGPHFYLREGDQVIRVEGNPMISKTPKVEWPDLNKKIREEEEEDYEGREEINTERWAWRSALDGEEPELYGYVIGLN